MNRKTFFKTSLLGILGGLFFTPEIQAKSENPIKDEVSKFEDAFERCYASSIGVVEKDFIYYLIGRFAMFTDLDGRQIGNIIKMIFIRFQGDEFVRKSVFYYPFNIRDFKTYWRGFECVLEGVFNLSADRLRIKKECELLGGVQNAVKIYAAMTGIQYNDPIYRINLL